jgi:hypothetical protein
MFDTCLVLHFNDYFDVIILDVTIVDVKCISFILDVR